MYIGTDDIKRLVDGALLRTTSRPQKEHLENEYGTLRGYLYAIKELLTEDKENE